MFADLSLKVGSTGLSRLPSINSIRHFESGKINGPTKVPYNGHDPAARCGVSIEDGEGPYKTFSDVEYQLKLEKGLCFHCDKNYALGHCCDENYAPGHGCKMQHLRVMFICEDDEEEEVGAESEKIVQLEDNK